MPGEFHGIAASGARQYAGANDTVHSYLPPVRGDARNNRAGARRSTEESPRHFFKEPPVGNLMTEWERRGVSVIVIAFVYLLHTLI